MKQIRKNVFETNSSSSHSFHIENKDEVDYDSIWPVSDDGVVELHYGEYDWGVDTLRSAREKAEYVLTYAQYENEHERVEMLIDVIKEHQGAKEVKIVKDSGFYEKGYVDHQSIGDLDDMFESKEKLKDLIFGCESFILIDNDNH